MSTKRTFSEALKLEDINDQLIKRQVPNTYTTTTTTTTTIPLLTHPQHNGLNATQQRANESFDVHDKIKPLMPPCKNCNNNDNVIEDDKAGAYICTACGLETGRVIIETAEWRSFGDGKSDPSRVTAENQYTGLENVVRTESNNGAKPLEQRRLAAVNNTLDTLRNALRTPDSLFYAARKIAEEYLLAPVDIIGQSPNSETLAAVCFFTAAFDAGRPVRKNDILSILQIQDKAYNRAEKRLQQAQEWWAKKHDKQARETNPVNDSVVHLNSYAKRLSLPKQAVDAASCIIKTAYDLNISRNSKPSTIAAATILFTLALQERPCNPHELARLSATTVETIRRHANELYVRRTEIVPDGFVDEQQITQMKFN